MTYCVAIRLDAGMIFASDSRTNAGVDHVATFSKMRVFEKADDRVIVSGLMRAVPGQKVDPQTQAAGAAAARPAP